jgi:hypothetical protein
MTNVLAFKEDELHPRLQVREYARYLQDPYRELLDDGLPENLADLIRQIDTSGSARTEQERQTTA